MYTQSNTAVLECRSRAQALDWSLVLISQGIESVIGQRAEDRAWFLEVAEADLARAQESVRAYERENATAWRREVKGTGMLFDARAAFWFVALTLFHFFAAGSATPFRSHGLMDRDAVLHGEWWRLFTATTLHGDAAHLAANAATGFVFLGLAMGGYGAGVALLLSLLGGALGNVATVLLHESPFRNLGASGFVMASLGLLAAQSVVLAPNEKRLVRVGRGIIAGVLLVVLLGFSEKSDVVAHVGGFVAGVALGAIALRLRGLLLKSSLQILAAVICVAIVVATWAFALR
jgi:membrane associated rhomboid family serine protease